MHILSVSSNNYTKKNCATFKALRMDAKTEEYLFNTLSRESWNNLKKLQQELKETRVWDLELEKTQFFFNVYFRNKINPPKSMKAPLLPFEQNGAQVTVQGRENSERYGLINQVLQFENEDMAKKAYETLDLNQNKIDVFKAKSHTTEQLYIHEIENAADALKILEQSSPAKPNDPKIYRDAKNLAEKEPSLWAKALDRLGYIKV